MSGLLLAVALISTVLVVVAAAMWLTVRLLEPAEAQVRNLQGYLLARRLMADVDQRYEELLRS